MLGLLIAICAIQAITMMIVGSISSTLTKLAAKPSTDQWDELLKKAGRHD